MRGVVVLAVALVAAHVLHELGLRRLLGWGGEEAPSPEAGAPGGEGGPASTGPAAGRPAADATPSIPLDLGLYALLTWLLLPVWTWGMLLLVAGLAAARGALLAWRRIVPARSARPLRRLLLVQGLHLAVLAAGVALAPSVLRGAGAWAFPWQWAGGLFGASGDAVGRGLIVLSGYLVAIPGGSVLVRALLAPFAGALPSGEGLSMGRTIGYLERFILLTLLLLGEYTAMAVIVAAKSLVRIPSISRKGIAARYFLIGTLASIAVALATALAVGRALRLL